MYRSDDSIQLNRISLFERVLLCGDHTFTKLVFRDWPPHEIMKLRAINHIICTLVDCYIPLGWNPDDTLRPWFKDPAKFRSILDQSKAFIIGATAFRFFDRHRCHEGDLDIAVRGQGLITLGYYLKRCGYVLSPSPLDGRDNFKEILLRGAAQSKRSYGVQPPIVRQLRFASQEELSCGMYSKKVRVLVIRTNPVRYLLSTKTSASVLCKCITLIDKYD